jgi:MoxR-like ATPase
MNEQQIEPEGHRVDAAVRDLRTLDREIRKAFVGQDALVDGVIIGLLARGNLLLEGQPGLGKTHLVKTLAQAVALEFSRIQFTPDLMPADITGTEALVQGEQGTRLAFRPGPLFAHVVLADEINRATPKTQSALLEAMQEASVTVAGVRRDLPAPFVVIATQNPVEMEGTYPLPEAQLDRFLLKLTVPFPGLEELRRIGVTTAGRGFAPVEPVLDRARLLELQQLVIQVLAAPHVCDYAARLVMATHSGCEDVERFVRYGASPRAMQALLLAGKARALLQGRPWVSTEDVIAVAQPVLAHRLILGFEAELEGVTAPQVVDVVVAAVPTEG